MTQFQILTDVPPEFGWFANLTNANTRWAYVQDTTDFMAFAGLRQPAQFRVVMRVHVITWRERRCWQTRVRWIATAWPASGEVQVRLNPTFFRDSLEE